MRYRVYDDPFQHKQPPFDFLKELNENVHKNVAKTKLPPVRVENRFPDPKGLLETAYADFHDYLDRAGAAVGDAFSFITAYAPTDRFETYTVTFSPENCVISAGDTEGIRRGLIYVEDEMQRMSGTLPRTGSVTRRPWLRSRIARCVFSPINKHLPTSEELADDVEYYSDNYLNRLAHDGVNGIWISTAFRFMLPSEIIPEYGIQWEKSIAKLNRTIEHCARYGIGIYLLANEPASCYMNDAILKHPEVMGEHDGKPTGFVCMSKAAGVAYTEECGRTLFTLAPGLRGLIVISVGESLTSCGSTDYLTCDLCRKNGLTLGAALAECEKALWRGISSVKPDAELISWTYAHRSWTMADIADACEHRGDGVIHMENFEDYGYHEQLGKTRLALDYWLSYTGPGEVFKTAAPINRAHGHETFAKLQVSCSHETASVPYLPVPGILFDKFKIMHEYGVTGAQYSWYFGSYPSIMTKIAGELAFTEDFSDKDAVLERAAAIWWQDKAKNAVEAWKSFSEAYDNVPSCVSFEWYGPLNDASVWPLFLEPVDLPLARSWTIENMNGDRWGECSLRAFTPEEVCELLRRLKTGWQNGIAALDGAGISADAEQQSQSDIAHAEAMMFESAYDALEFYRLRNVLGYGRADAVETLDRMEAILRREIAVSEALCGYCHREPGLGYHSEAIGYKFFPEKLAWRVEYLRKILAESFPAVRARIARGNRPLPFFYGEAEGNHRYLLPQSIETAAWQSFSFRDGTPDPDSAVRAAFDGRDYVVQLRISEDAAIDWFPEYELFVPSPNLLIHGDGTYQLVGGKDYGIWGDETARELARYRIARTGDCVTVRFTPEAFGKKPAEPWRLRLERRGVGVPTDIWGAPIAGAAAVNGRDPSYWVLPDREFRRLIFGNYSPDAYAFMVVKAQN